MRNAPGARLVVKAVRVLIAQRVRRSVREVAAKRHLRPRATTKVSLVILPVLDPPAAAGAAHLALGHHLVIFRVGVRYAPVAARAVFAADRVGGHNPLLASPYFLSPQAHLYTPLRLKDTVAPRAPEIPLLTVVSVTQIHLCFGAAVHALSLVDMIVPVGENARLAPGGLNYTRSSASAPASSSSKSLSSAELPPAKRSPSLTNCTPPSEALMRLPKLLSCAHSSSETFT